MADVKWIKIVTDVFDDEKMLLIESLPSADSIIIVWFKLLCLAGKTNNSGVFIFNDRIPYTDEMLASIFRRDINIVRLALKTFEEFGMIEIVDKVITIPNWSKHQSLDAYEKKKERDRLRAAEKRAEQRAIIAKSPDKSPDASPDKSPDVAPLEEDKERDIDLEEDKEGTRPPDGERPGTPAPVPYETIKNLYNTLCPSFPRCTALSDARKKAIKARIASGYTLEDFKALFTKAEASGFLKGRNDRNWSATFDWLLKDSNMAKVLDGNYDEHGKGSVNGAGKRLDDLDFIPE
jgi:predicted phage replisome organizer